MTVPDGYELAWSDNFLTSNLDTEKWFTRLIDGNPPGGIGQYLPSNGEQQRYGEAGNHVMQKPGVALTALPPIADGTYPSGVLRSKRLINPAGSYIEINAKMPSYKGMWAGGWLRSDAKPDGSVTWPPELDIFEVVDNGDDLTTMIHAGGKTSAAWPGAQGLTIDYADPNWNGQYQFLYSAFDTSAAFHTYAIQLEGGRYTIWGGPVRMISGVYNWVYDDGTAAVWPHLILQHAIGGPWAGRNGIDNTKLPAAVQVAWVHVYEKATFSTMGQDLMPNGG